jgi:uncharacterized protein (DUF427 family)
MLQAVWNGAVLAESDQTIKIEGNHYFPPGSLRREYLTCLTGTCMTRWKRCWPISAQANEVCSHAWFPDRPAPPA